MAPQFQGRRVPLAAQWIDRQINQRIVLPTGLPAGGWNDLQNHLWSRRP